MFAITFGAFPVAPPMHLLVALLLVLLAVPAALAQPADSTAGPRRVLLLDGTVVVGVIEDEGADPLVIRTAGGIEQRVPRAQVREVTALYEGRFTRLDPNRSRLFITPTGRTLGRGSGRFGTFLYLFPGVAYGATDRIDVSASAMVPLSDGTDFFTMLNFHAKGQLVPLAPGGGLAVGASALVPIGAGAIGVGGTFYGVATFGSDTQAFTLAAIGLYGGVFGEDADFGVADGVILVGGYERQLSNSIKLISENALFVGEGEVGGGTLTGVRFFSDRLAADIAVAAAGADGEFAILPLPYVGLSYNFGR